MSHNFSRKRRRVEKDYVEETDPKDVYNLTPWASASSSKSCETVEERLHEEIVGYVNYMAPTSEEAALRQRVFRTVQAVVTNKFRDAEAQIHGSAATGLSLPGGDIDICVSMTCHNVNGVLFSLSSALRASGITNDVKVIRFARVPILTFTTLPKYGSISVDMGINNSDGVTCVGIINEYLQKMPALKPLVLVLKCFLKQRGLATASRNGLGSYATILMCISFLQLNPCGRPEEFLSDPYKTRSLGALLSDLLLYYGFKFPYSDSCISVTEEKLLLKDDLDWVDQRVQNRLVTQCLINPLNDVSKSLNTNRMEQLVEAFKSAYGDFTQSTLQSSDCLGLIVCVNQKMVDNRQSIKDVVDKGLIEELPTNSKDLNTRSSYTPSSSSYGGYNRPSHRGAPYPSQYQQREHEHASSSGRSLASRITDNYSSRSYAPSSSRGYGGYDERHGGGGRYRGDERGQSRYHDTYRDDGRRGGEGRFRDVERSGGGGGGRSRPVMGALSDVVASALERDSRRKRDRE